MWTRSVNDGVSEQLIDGSSTNDIVMILDDDNLRATSISMLMVNTTMSGNHVYTCGASLVVSPAPDNISAEAQTTVSNIIGELNTPFMHSCRIY